MAYNKRGIQLAQWEASEELYNAILTYKDAGNHVKVVSDNDFNAYKTGYPDRSTLVLNKERNEFICDAATIVYLTNNPKIFGDPCPYKSRLNFYQVRIILNPEFDGMNGLGKSVTGTIAYNYIMTRVHNLYGATEIDLIFNECSAQRDSNLIQQHFLYCTPNELLRFDNCYYYDINCAHGSAWIELFPLMKQTILDMYAKRKDNNGYFKKIFNYSVGMLCRKNHRETYNWIVQRTTRMMIDLYTKVGGDMVYINTDGIILQKPNKPIPNSDKMGEFKLRRGTVYTYRHEPKDDIASSYEIYQIYYEDGTTEIKGNLPKQLREGVDLRQGRIVTYIKTKVQHHYEYSNVEIKEVK